MPALLDAFDTLRALDADEVSTYRSSSGIEGLARSDFANADEVKAAADVVRVTNDDDGIARFLEQAS